MPLRNEKGRNRMLQRNEIFVRLLTAGMLNMSHDISLCPVTIGARNGVAPTASRINHNNK
ncbi:MAG: hypothetical protein ACI88G_001414 [Woeseiaceae bacterium]|jgi:hypothetical protein